VAHNRNPRPISRSARVVRPARNKASVRRQAVRRKARKIGRAVVQVDRADKVKLPSPARPDNLAGANPVEAREVAHSAACRRALNPKASVSVAHKAGRAEAAAAAGDVDKHET
jgi:hypothetical protein